MEEKIKENISKLKKQKKTYCAWSNNCKNENKRYLCCNFCENKTCCSRCKDNCKNKQNIYKNDKEFIKKINSIKNEYDILIDAFDNEDILEK